MNETNRLDNQIATAGAQLSSLHSRDATSGGNSSQDNADIINNNNSSSSMHTMMPRRESIGVVNVLGDALFNRRTSLGFGGDMMGDMTGFGGDRMMRRGSMDSVVDAAIQNLTNRRLSMLGGSTHTSMNTNAMNNTMGGGIPSMMGGGIGMMGMQSQSMNGMNGPMGMNENGTRGMSSQMNQFLMNGLGLTSMMTGNNNLGVNNDGTPKNGSVAGASNAGSANSSMDGSTSMRQKQLQQQRLELQRRQKELELQRQQLLSAMEERKQAMQQMQESIQRGALQHHQQADRRLSLFGGALTSMPFAEQLSSPSDRRGSFGGGGDKLDTQWRRNSGFRDKRRGSLDLLVGAITQESEMNNNMKNTKSEPPAINSNGPAPGPVVSAQSADFSTIKKPIPLGLPADKDWLTPLHCFVRLHCVEVFTATKVDVAIPTKGKRKPIQIGQVGIRCPHCHNSESGLISRERGSVYYPTSVSSIYNATMNLLQRHLHNCTSVKPEIMKRYETLKSDDARSGTSKKYWAESALSLGLVDTPEGIRFSNSEPPPLPSLTSEQKARDNYSASRGNDDSFFNSASNALTSFKSEGPNGSANGLMIDGKDEGGGGSANGPINGEYSDPNAQLNGDEGAGVDTEKSLANSAPLVTPADEKFATQFSFYLLGQMQMCVFTEADRLGKRKGLPPGFPGLACRHCFGGYGSGRFFPSSIKTLSDTSKTLNVLYNHMMRCRKCPTEVRETLEKLRKVHDEQRAKMKFGSQKAFFARIWDRLHENDPNVDSRKRKFNQPKKLKSKPAPAPMHNATAENLMNMQMGGSHLSQSHSYLDAANAFSNLGGLSTAGLLDGFGVGGMLQGNNGFNPSSAQYSGGDMGANKRRKI